MSTLRIASIFALAAALAACGGSSDSGTGSDDTGSSTTDSGSGGTDTGSTHDTGGGTDSSPADSGVDAPKDTAVADTGSGDSTSTDSTTTDSTTTDSTTVDSVATDSTTTDSSTTDTAPAPTAWWHSCTASTTCAAPSGETGFCATVYGQPECSHTCDGQLAYSLCEGGAGMCVPTTNSTGGTTNVCVKKCGDIEKATCGAGAACGFLGYRGNSLTDGGTEYDAVGACVPDCATSGADACTGAGTACDPARKACRDIGCTGADACPTGSSCVAGSSYCMSSSPTALYGACTNTTTTANGCTSNLCFGESGAAGFCSIFCDSATGSVTCGTGGVCWYENNLDVAGTSIDSGTIAYPEFPFTITGDRSAGACLKTCTDTADCPAGFYCAESNGKRACVPGAIPEAAPTTGEAPGEVCHANTDCASGVCGKAAAYVDGICLKSTTGTCPTGTVAGTALNECDKICDPTVDNACDGSLVCIDNSPGTSTCTIGLCRESSDCATGNICDHATSTCRPTASSGGTATGTACTADTTCSGGYCIKETTTPSAWPGGYCSEPCTVLPDLSDTCTNGTICSAARMGGLGVCLKLCDTTAPFSVYGTCRAGYKCQVLGDPAVGYCTTT